MHLDSIVRHVIPANVLPLDVVVQLLAFVGSSVESPIPPPSLLLAGPPSGNSLGFAKPFASGNPARPMDSSRLFAPSLVSSTLANYTLPFPLAPRSATEPVFTYTHDFDTNGILYFLGTNGGRAPVWSNPQVLGEVDITFGPGNLETTYGSRTVADVVGRGQASVYVFAHNGDQPVHFTFRFRNISICPSAYTVRTWLDPGFAHVPEAYHMRSWRFQGSNDGAAWRDISVHVGDTSLHQMGECHTWNIVPLTGNMFFSHFRIVLTGKTLYHPTHMKRKCCRMDGSCSLW